MGKRIAIVTIYGIPNFGSILQAYALQRYLEATKKDSEVLLVNYDYRGFIHRVKRIRETGFVSFLKNEIALILRIIPDNKKKKLAKFQEFRNLYLKETRCYTNSISLLFSNEIKKFDVFITGSDQVWNTRELHGDLTYLLDFVPNNKKKISYSSSFGLDYIGDGYKKSFQKLLNKYDAISVREKRGITLIEELGVDKPIDVTCDPTLLLESTDYSALVATSKAIINEPYILVYGLSYAFNPMPAIFDVINLAVAQYKCKVIFLTNGNIPFEGRAEYVLDAGPADFIKYVLNAKFIITSSFHGTLFSIIFRKPFAAIAPKSGDTRIFDILDDLNIGRVLVVPNSPCIALSNDNIYNGSFEEQLKRYIEKSKVYLDKNI